MFIRLRAGQPLGVQIYNGLREAVLDRRLPPGGRVPSTRRLADELGVSRTIVLIAYDQLRAEGYFVGRRGSGTYVSSALPDELLGFPIAGRGPSEAPRPARLSRAGRLVASVEATTQRSPGGSVRLPIDFRFGEPAESDFPHRVWHRSMAKCSTHTTTQYGSSEGSTRLRGAIAEYLRRARGVACGSEQIVVVNGSQQALDLLARLLVDPGDRAAVEDPGYDGARAALRAAGARVVSVPVDAEGLRVDRLPAPGKRCRLVVTTPTHQFPLGGTLPIGRRLALLDWARRCRAYVVEDDYDGEYRYASRPIEPLITLDTHGSVVYVGTFSKILSPALRIGYAVLPTPLVTPFAAAKFAADRESPPTVQLALAELIESGRLEAHIRRVRTRNAERREALVAAVHQHMDTGVRIVGENAGCHLVLLFEHLTVGDVDGVVNRAARCGVGVFPIAPFYHRAPRPGLLMCYQALEPDEITEGIERLAAAINCSEPRSRS